MHNFLYIRLCEPWGMGMHRLSTLAEGQRHSPQWIFAVLTVRLEPPSSRLAELVRGANNCATSQDTTESKALTYRDIIQSFTPKNWPQKNNIYQRNWTGNHQRLPWKQEACPVNDHKSCNTVTMNVNKDRGRGFGPRTPHSSCCKSTLFEFKPNDLIIKC